LLAYFEYIQGEFLGRWHNVQLAGRDRKKSMVIANNLAGGKCVGGNLCLSSVDLLDYSPQPMANGMIGGARGGSAAPLT